MERPEPLAPEVNILQSVNIEDVPLVALAAVETVEPTARELVLVTTSAVDLTPEERAWCLANGRDAANALLTRWYRHGRPCRRAARKRGQGPLVQGSPMPCLCF